MNIKNLLCTYIAFFLAIFTLNAQTFEDALKDIKVKGKSTYNDLLKEKAKMLDEKEQIEVLDFLKKFYADKTARAKEKVDSMSAVTKTMNDSLNGTAKKLTGLYADVAGKNTGPLNTYVESKQKDVKTRMDSLAMVKPYKSSYIPYGLNPDREAIAKDLVDKYDAEVCKIELMERTQMVITDYQIEMTQLHMIMAEDKKRMDVVKKDIESIKSTMPNQGNDKKKTDEGKKKKKTSSSSSSKSSTSSSKTSTSKTSTK